MKLKEAGFIQIIFEDEVVTKKRKSGENKMIHSDTKIYDNTKSRKLNDCKSKKIQQKVLEAGNQKEIYMKNENKKAKNKEINEVNHEKKLSKISEKITHENILPQSGFIIDTPNRFYCAEKKKRKKLRS